MRAFVVHLGTQVYYDAAHWMPVPQTSQYKISIRFTGSSLQLILFCCPCRSPVILEISWVIVSSPTPYPTFGNMQLVPCHVFQRRRVYERSAGCQPFGDDRADAGARTDSRQLLVIQQARPSQVRMHEPKGYETWKAVRGFGVRLSRGPVRQGTPGTQQLIDVTCTWYLDTETGN
jgi:hypothetical protein